MRQHASGWRSQRLGEICERIDYGLTASSSERKVGPRYLRITDIQRGHVRWGDVPFCECKSGDIARFELREGDIVFARTGATTGKSFLITACPETTVFASYLIRVRPCAAVDSRYLKHYFETPEYWSQISRSSTGTAQPGVNAGKLRNLMILIPPLPEQRRIAAILDKADAIRRKRREAIQLTEDLLRSVFLDMFGDPVTNPKGWPTARLGEIAKVQGGLQVTSRRQPLPLEVPYLRVANVYRDHLDLSEMKTIRVTELELKRSSLQDGDILVVEGHGNPAEIGRASTWDGSISPCVHQNHLIRVRVNRGRAEPRFMSAFLNSPGGRRQLNGFRKTTSGLNTISTSNVSGVRVPVPPLSLQRRWREVVSKQVAIAEQARKHENQSSDLFAHLSLTAFRGEMTCPSAARREVE